MTSIYSAWIVLIWIPNATSTATLGLPASANCGNQAELTCTSTGCNQGYRFSRNGVIIYSNAGPLGDIDPGKYNGTLTSSNTVKLTITNIQLADAGTYACTCGFDKTSTSQTMQYTCKASTSKATITNEKKLSITVDNLYPQPLSIVAILTSPSTPLTGMHSCGPSTLYAVHYKCTWVSTASLPDGDRSYTMTVTTGTEVAAVTGTFRIVSAVIIPLPNVTAEEGERNFALTCSASSKPPATFTWFKGNTVLTSGTGTLTDNSFSYVIPLVDRTDAGSYRCQAGNNVGVQDLDIVHLRIKYPPSMTVSTTSSPVYTVTCTAEGYPDNYTYQDWVQIWPGYGPVATLSFTGPTLTLTDVTYEVSGIYMCGASNGVALYGTDIATINANGTLTAHVPPVLIDPPASEFKTPVAGEEGMNITTYIKYWSNTDDNVVSCYKRVNGSRLPDSRCSFLETETTVTLPVYNHMVSETGKLARVTIQIRTKDDLGDYDFVVSNAEHLEAVLKVLISRPGPPSSPTLTRVDQLPNGFLLLLVTPGFHGGYSQTLVAQTSTDRVTWDNITSVNIGQNDQPTILTSNNISINTLYYVRVFAFNIKGRSRRFSEIVNVTKNNDLDGQHHLENTAYIAIAAAVTACVVLVSTVLIIACVCRFCPNCSERILLFIGCRVLRNNACLRGNVPSSGAWNHQTTQHTQSDLGPILTRQQPTKHFIKRTYIPFTWNFGERNTAFNICTLSSCKIQSLGHNTTLIIGLYGTARVVHF